MSGRRVAARAAWATLALAVLYAGWPWRSRPAAPPLVVEYAGCAAVLAGPVCVPTAERRLAIWLAGAPDAGVHVRGARALGPEVAIQGGRRLHLQLDPEAERLDVIAGTRRFTLSLGREPRPAWMDELRSAMRSDALDVAAARLAERLHAGPAGERGRVLGAWARLELRRGRAQEATALLRRALVEHRLQGRALDLVDDTTVLVFVLLFQERRFDDARRLLEALGEAGTVCAEAGYYVDYYRGLLALATGDLRSGLHALSEAVRRAERLGLTRLQRTAEQVLAEPLQQLGRRTEAETLLQRLQRDAPADLPACERAQLLNTLGWNRLLIREQGEPGPDPLPVLEQARALLRSGCAHLTDEAWNVGLNLALARLQGGDIEGARAALAAAVPPARPALHLVLWQREIEARLALARGRPREAFERYDQLGQLAEATLAFGARWRAAQGRAQAMLALGRPEAALRAYAEAEQRLDEDTRHVPLHEGRESFVAGHERATRVHLALLLELGHAEAAWVLAHRAHTRIVSALARGERLASLTSDERRAWDATLSEYRTERDALAAAVRDDWRLPADRLRALGAQRLATRRALDGLLDRAFARLDARHAQALPAARNPRPGEALLALHPLPQGAAVLLRDADGLLARRVDCPGSEQALERLGTCLLAPFAVRLRAARHVTLLPYGRLAAIDVHALVLDGAPLLAGRSVSWSLALGAAEAPLPGAPATALLVGDPRGDLPAARGEVAEVARTLAQARPAWRVLRLEGAAAEYAQVRARLAQADLFHFAGHGYFGGRAGWDSALPLAQDAALGLGDVLALERAPRLAVLAGCETGRAHDDTAQALGLAQAFVSRGTQAVLAATRAVDDRSTAALVARFYAHWTAGQTPATALRRAQLALRAADGHADWAAFRVLEP
jgi:tetratricopeptide (TPR) repeat protein